uniref:Uncharacterized protein n=1 Tax=viral metagenome TaxID=1070528 RepID=A0A6H1ZPA2_9ZZZZ
MPTYTHDKIVEIIGAYHQVHAALNKLESALAKVDIEEYKKPGQDFIRDMAFCYRRMMETHIVYRSDVVEAESILGRDIGTDVIDLTAATMKAFNSLADEDGILRGAE